MRNDLMRMRASLFLAIATVAFSVLGNSGSGGSVIDVHVNEAIKAEEPDGSAARPFADVFAARDAVRRFRRQFPKAKITVLLHGDFHPGQVLELGPEDSGTSSAPVVWRGAGNDRARLSSGVVLPSAGFSPVKDEARRERLDDRVRDRVRVISLAPYFKDSLPTFDEVYDAAPKLPVLFADHKVATLARWPNKSVGYAMFDPAKAVSGLPSKEAKKKGEKIAPGAFPCTAPRASRWNFDEGVWADGYWTWDWSTEVIRMARFDAQSGMLEHAYPARFGVGGAAFTHPFGKTPRRYAILNVFDELDEPGEYWVDRPNKMLYYLPPCDDPAVWGELVLVSNRDPVIRANRGLQNVRFERIDFEYSYSAFAEFPAVTNVVFAGCRFRNGADAGLVITGRGNHVRSCDFSELGTVGVQVEGGDLIRLEPGSNVVENCHIHHVSVFKHNYAPGVRMGGCGNVIRNCRIHDVPHNAVFYGGGELLFEYNDVYRAVMESGDAGAYYCGRSWLFYGNVYRYNYTHDLGAYNKEENSTAAFYFDDLECGDAVYGNIFKNLGIGVIIGGGRDHPVSNNVFVSCRTGVWIDSRAHGWLKSVPDGEWKNYRQPWGQAMVATSEWKTRYPHFARLPEDTPEDPKHNPIVGNVFCRTAKLVELDEWIFAHFLDSLEMHENVYLRQGDGVQSCIDERIKGFSEVETVGDLKDVARRMGIAMDRIGIYSDIWRGADGELR